MDINENIFSMFRSRIPLQMVKLVMKDSKANLNTQQIVDKTKSVIQNAAESTKELASAAKEKLSNTLGMQKNAAPELPHSAFQGNSSNEMKNFNEFANAANAQQVVGKTKVGQSIDNALNTEDMSAKEKKARTGIVFDEGLKPTAQSAGNNPNELKKHGLTEKERAGKDEKMNDPVQEHLEFVKNHPKSTRS